LQRRSQSHSPIGLTMKYNFKTESEEKSEEDLAGTTSNTAMEKGSSQQNKRIGREASTNERADRMSKSIKGTSEVARNQAKSNSITDKGRAEDLITTESNNDSILLKGRKGRQSNLQHKHKASKEPRSFNPAQSRITRSQAKDINKEIKKTVNAVKVKSDKLQTSVKVFLQSPNLYKNKKKKNKAIKTPDQGNKTLNLASPILDKARERTKRLTSKDSVSSTSSDRRME